MKVILLKQMSKDSVKARIRKNCFKIIKLWLLLDEYEEEINKRKYGYRIEGIDVRIYREWIYLTLDIIELENETVKIEIRPSLSLFSLILIIPWSFPLITKVIFNAKIPFIFALAPLLLLVLVFFIAYISETKELYRFVNKIFEDVLVSDSKYPGRSTSP